MLIELRCVAKYPSGTYTWMGTYNRIWVLKFVIPIATLTMGTCKLGGPYNRGVLIIPRVRYVADTDATRTHPVGERYTELE